MLIKKRPSLKCQFYFRKERNVLKYSLYTKRFPFSIPPSKQKRINVPSLGHFCKSPGGFALSTSSSTSSWPLVWVFSRWGKTPDIQYAPVQTWCKRKTKFWNWFAWWILLFSWPDSNFTMHTALSIFLVIIQMFQHRNAVNSIVNYVGPNSKVFLLPKNIIRKISRNKTHVLFSLEKTSTFFFENYICSILKEAHFS